MNIEQLTASPEFSSFKALVDSLDPAESLNPHVRAVQVGMEGLLTQAPPAVTFEQAREFRKKRVKELRDQHEHGGVVTPYGVFDSDPDSQRKIAGAVIMAMIAAQNEQPFEIDWRLHDNSVVSLNTSEMIEVGVLIGQHVAACQQVKNTLDAEIELAETIEDLDAIDIFAGWPGAVEPEPEEDPEDPE